MIFRKLLFLMAFVGSSIVLNGETLPIPEKMDRIMKQQKYQHSTWGIYVKDSKTGAALLDLNSHQLFLPASTTKLFSTAALLNAYGDHYRFKTPVYVQGEIQNSKLKGNLILVAQGDFTFGGRQNDADHIAFTKMDHIYANNIPGAILTPQDPLKAVIELANQVKASGLKEIEGDILIDDRLFETLLKRGMILSPMMINENLIDFVINSAEEGSDALVSWRPQVEGYSVKSKLKTVATDEPLDIQITSDDLGRAILIQGTIPSNQKNVVRTFSIKDPIHFAKAAFIQALRRVGVKVNLIKNQEKELPPQYSYQGLTPVAIWTSPPLTEYTKLILKVSHNIGADLIPLLLAAQKGKTTFNAGMALFGDFVLNTVKISPDEFVFIDGAGGDENRVTPKAEIALLSYMKSLPLDRFKKYYDGLPILGVDGSLEDFAKNSSAVGKARAKPGTGIALNLATNRYFLNTQALGGYVEGKNGQLMEYLIVVNNGQMNTMDDIFPIFEDLSQMTAIIYDISK